MSPDEFWPASPAVEDADVVHEAKAAGSRRSRRWRGGRVALSRLWCRCWSRFFRMRTDCAALAQRYGGDASWAAVAPATGAAASRLRRRRGRLESLVVQPGPVVCRAAPAAAAWNSCSHTVNATTAASACEQSVQRGGGNRRSALRRIARSGGLTRSSLGMDNHYIACRWQDEVG